MSIKENPLVALIEESIHLRDSAQRILSDALGGESLTRLERLVLLSISEAGHPLTASQVARNLGHSRQVVLRAAKQLVALSLIRKKPNPDHKSSALLEPTVKGRDFERQMGERLIEIVNSLLTENDIKSCERICKELRRLRVVIETYETP